MNSASGIGLVLHTLAWRETSLIIEVFTRDHGRLGLVARGARRPRSALRGLLQPFQPLDLRWSGKTELRNLMSAEWVGGMPPLSGKALMSGFYLNELIIRLLPREDAHPALFDDYLETLNELAGLTQAGGPDRTEPILRRFECTLLREMGYAPSFDRESATGELVLASRHYTVTPQTGISRIGQTDPGKDADSVSGEVLLVLSRARSSIEEVAQMMQDARLALQCKRLLRSLLGHHLGDEALQSREVIREMYRL